MEKTLVILKPSAVQRSLVGEVTARFEKKGLRLAGMKMMQLTDELLDKHYAHLAGKPFFQRIKNSMMAAPVVCCVFEGIDAVEVVRLMTGSTNGRKALPGTIRGDFGMSFQENIIHASDSPENAIAEINRFFNSDEIFEYKLANMPFLYANDEY
ncbi:MAG: nucleoside-diphosphate kinase [Bacteroidaceae bacterium]|nr:nucleoside-diphosphate kinase [Bacteroidaceae bacterium]